MAVSEKPHLFDSPRNVRRVIQALVAAAGLSLAAELVIERHVDHPWESLFGFYALYGFVACVVLVLAAKEILRRLVMRRDDYYDE